MQAREPPSALAQYRHQLRTEGRLARGRVEHPRQEASRQMGAMALQQAQPLGLQRSRMHAAQQHGEHRVRTRRAWPQMFGRRGVGRRRYRPGRGQEAAALPQVERAEREPERGLGLGLRDQRVQRRGRWRRRASGTCSPDLQQLLALA